MAPHSDGCCTPSACRPAAKPVTSKDYQKVYQTPSQYFEKGTGRSVQKQIFCAPDSSYKLRIRTVRIYSYLTTRTTALIT